MQRWLTLIAAFLIAGCAAVAPTQAQGTASDAPPLIAGRVAVAEGDAQIWRVEEDSAGQWDGAQVNDVVSVGTGLYTGADGRNEVRIGPHTFRLGANSRGGFGQLDYATAVFNLEYGTLNVRLASPEHGETTAVTVGDLRLELVAPGRYRIDGTNAGPTRLTVFEGHGTVRSANNALGASASQAIVVNPGGNGFNFEQPVATGFDQWALGRDEHYRQVRSVQYVSPYMTGYEELDTHGEWTPDVAYGTVWYPRVVPVGWAPYRYGQWRWVRPWGWTWVDQAPWGYAPFHYGRWVMLGGRWAWVPGGYVRRPVWAPALVGFVGSNVSVSVGVGPVVGWYPLAPWNRYEPHYRHNPTYVTVINQTIIHRPPAGVPHTINQGPGSTLVPGGRFREPIQRVVLSAPPRPEQLKPIAPPPLNVAPAPRPSTRKYAEHEGRPGAVTRPSPVERGGPSAPPQGPQPLAPQAQPSPGPTPQGQAPQGQAPQPGSPPTRVRPPIVADPVPGRGVAPPPPIPGNDPSPLGQPPGLKRGQLEPRSPPPPAPPPPERVAPRPQLPSDQIPPGQPRPANPAEPPRFPPGAPPTIRQPPSMAPAARPVQPSPPAPPVQPAPARPAPPVAAPAAPTPPAPVAAPHPQGHPPQSQKEQVLRNLPDPARGQPAEREAPPPRGKQIDR